jgi:light-regulated signal transduction histidine kinase (bacteriophytochrome)
MENALRQANADLEQFAYAAAHDLQEPARTVGLYSQLLAKECGESLDQEKRELVSGIVQAARRMQELIRDLLAYTRAVENHSDDDIETDANDAFQDVVDNLRSFIDKSHAKICCGVLPRIQVRKAHLVQIFQNTLTNALKYGGKPPVVDVSAEQIGADCLFSIRDNGAGIPPEYHERIFKVFTRLHGKQIPGTGIGLAICERIVRHYGGRIWVKSEAGWGATFQFIFPNLHRE